jgi:hypothetical protein
MVLEVWLPPDDVENKGPVFPKNSPDSIGALSPSQTTGNHREPGTWGAREAEETRDRPENVEGGEPTPGISPEGTPPEPAQVDEGDSNARPLGQINSEGKLTMTVEDLPEFARRLRSYGWRVKQRGDELDCQPPSLRSKRGAKRKRGHIQPLETTRNVPAPPVLPMRPCYACQGVEFWISRYGAVVCKRCHPPANVSLVTEWYRLAECEPAPALDITPQEPTPEAIELACKIGDFFDLLEAGQSATAAEIAGALFGEDYTLDQVVEIDRISKQLSREHILRPGRDGYGFELDLSPSLPGSDIFPQDEPVKTRRIKAVI